MFTFKLKVNSNMNGAHYLDSCADEIIKVIYSKYNASC